MTKLFWSNYLTAKIQKLPDLTNVEIAVTREQLPVLPPHEFYKVDLEGLKVINTNGIELGIVKDILETGANDVLMVKNDRKECAIPYLKNTILEVD